MSLEHHPKQRDVNGVTKKKFASKGSVRILITYDHENYSKNYRQMQCENLNYFLGEEKFLWRRKFFP